MKRLPIVTESAEPELAQYHEYGIGLPPIVEAVLAETEAQQKAELPSFHQLELDHYKELAGIRDLMSAIGLPPQLVFTRGEVIALKEYHRRSDAIQAYADEHARDTMCVCGKLNGCSAVRLA